MRVPIPKFGLSVLFLLISLGGYCAESAKLNLLVSTKAQTHNGGSIQLNLGETNLDSLGSTLDAFNTADGTALVDGSTPVEVIVVVPKEASEEAIRAFCTQVVSSIQTRYPRMQLVLKRAYKDLQSEEAIFAQIEGDVARQLSMGAPNTQDVAIAKIVNQAIASGRSEIQNLRRSWFLIPTLKRLGAAAINKVNDSHPYNTLIAANLVALGKFGAAGTVMVSKYGLSLSSVLLGFASGTVSASFGFNAKQWSRIGTEHVIPFAKDHPVIKWYNQTGWFKSTHLNIWRSVALSWLFRWLAFLSGQEIEGTAIADPTNLLFLSQALRLAVPECFLDGVMDQGTRSLEQKGIINHQTRTYLLLGVGLNDTFMHGCFRTGLEEAALAALMVGSTAKIAIGWAGRDIPAGPARFVVQHGSLAEQSAPTSSNHTQTPRTQREIVRQLRGAFLYVPTRVAALFQALANRVTGNFPVSEATLQTWDLGTDESWNLDLTPEQLDRIATDPELPRSEFENMLKVGDSDRALMNIFWTLRQERLQTQHPEPDSRRSLHRLCADALASYSRLRTSE